jgi:hypothetical protein
VAHQELAVQKDVAGKKDPLETNRGSATFPTGGKL